MTINLLSLGLVEMVAENCVKKLGLRNPELVCGSLNEFLVLVSNDERLVLSGERPRAHVADQHAALTRIALVDVALLTKRLPVAEIIGPSPQARNFVVGAQFHVWLLPPAGGAFVVILLLESLPVSSWQFRPWLALLAYVQALQLVFGAFLSNRGETLFTLQLAQPPEYILVCWLAQGSFECIYRSANLLFRKDGTRDAVSGGPERGQEGGVDSLVRLARLDEPTSSVREPLLSASFGFVRRRPRCEEKALTGSGFGHLRACVK